MFLALHPTFLKKELPYITRNLKAVEPHLNIAGNNR